MSEMAERIEDAAQRWRRYRGHTYEQAAYAFLRATIEQATKQFRATETTK